MASAINCFSAICPIAYLLDECDDADGAKARLHNQALFFRERALKRHRYSSEYLFDHRTEETMTWYHAHALIAA